MFTYICSHTYLHATFTEVFISILAKNISLNFCGVYENFAGAHEI